MTESAIATTIRRMLAERGQDATVAPDASLFASGRLDSLAATEVMLHLEAEHGVDLSDPDFDIAQLDTIADLERLTAAA